MLNGITTLHEYLKVEEELYERDRELGFNITGGALEETALGRLALGDVESALRICRMIPIYYQKYSRLISYDEDLVAYANRMISSAIAMESQIVSGSIEELLSKAAARDAQSTEACIKFFGEGIYLNS